MKKTLANVCKLLLGMVVGFLVIFLLTTNEEMLEIYSVLLPGFEQPDISITISSYKQLLILFAVCAAMVFVVTQVIRYFTSTKNLNTATKFMDVFVEIFLGIPITTIIFLLFNTLTGGILGIIDNAGIRLIVYCIIYSCIFEAICILFEKTYLRVLKKGHKRCKLLICEAINEAEYREAKMVAGKMSFEDCYATMKNMDDTLTTRQFYRIVEMNWNGKKEVDWWKYYHNLNFIYEDDEELCKKLLKNEEANDIVWQG
jgi:hypothetical protein